MEDQNQKNYNPQQAQPLTEASGSSYISSSQPKKVLQPSVAFVQEVKAEQAEREAVEPQQSQAGVEGPTQQSAQTPISQPSPAPLQTVPQHTMGATPIAAATPSQQASSGPNSIYPEATRGINSNGAGYPPPASVNETNNTAEAYTFDDGYEIGKTVFIYQLVAGLVIGLLSPHFIQTFYHIPIVLAIVYVVEYLIMLYLPYHVLRSEKITEPFWITLTGTAAQTIIIAMGYALMAMIVKATGSLDIFFVIVVGIGFLVASYFLTKLSWGIAFSLVGKIKNKVLIKVVGIGLVTLFVGSIAYHFGMQTSNRVSNTATNTTSSVQQSNGLARYHVAGNPSFSVDFYAGSKTSNGAGGGSLTYSTGHAAQGVNLSVSNAITLNANSSCSSAANNSEFNFSIQGSTGIVCVSNNKSMSSYIGYIQVNGKSYVINMFAFSYQPNLATVKAIFNSITIG